MKEKAILAFCLMTLILLISPSLVLSESGTAVIQWKFNNEDDISGYNVYQGTSSRNYGPPMPVGKTNRYLAEDLGKGKTYFFAVTALDAAGNESGFSKEVSKKIPTTVDIALAEETPIPLPAYGTYGRIKWGDRNHVRKVQFTFEGQPGDLGVTYECYDIDWDREVIIHINDQILGSASVTRNQRWSPIQTVKLPDKYVNDSGPNLLVFENRTNANDISSGEPLWWGVRNVAVCDLIPLPAHGAYGHIRRGDRSHVNNAQFVFGGRTGDVGIEFEAYDIDFKDEVGILINGQLLGHVRMTQNQKWSHIQTLIIPDGLVADSGTNVLAFDNKLNPRKSAPLWWGVRNVGVFAPIPLSDGGAYGYIPHGDRSHANHVQFVFEGRPGDMTVSYEDFDIDFEDEVRIIVNGQMIGNAKMTANQEWGELTNITIPDMVVEDSGPNILIFDNKLNTNSKISNPLWWGIRSVAVF